MAQLWSVPSVPGSPCIAQPEVWWSGPVPAGLGSIVKVASKKSKKVDRFFHCCNKVGLQWADRHRVKLLLVNVLLGCVAATCGVMGAFGLSDQTLHVLPWGYMSGIQWDAGKSAWWGCGNDYNGTGCAALSAAIAAAYSTPGKLAQTDMYLNQWGACVHFLDAGPSYYDPALMEKVWDDDAVGITRSVDGGYCRGWADMTEEMMAYTPGLKQCTSGGVDGFSLVMVQGSHGSNPISLLNFMNLPMRVRTPFIRMLLTNVWQGAFGSVIKIFEPLSRMKKSTDRHQKTVVLMILVSTSQARIHSMHALAHTGCTH